ncbi:site-specific integrase [Polaromonas sp. SM01]|uniref:site-specific integrase n=1 Tax=Polaromonas sp. SM01 TaxID=3085630 RepID=UPI0029815089|nr:site-specific integrase [Polaromonas sp. SM01]MDW5443791.1 site-specific integrase [Polaromonas sp. SM01]
MATVQNRSRYIVTVPRHPELERRFPYFRLKDVKAYLEELRAKKLKPSVTQATDVIQVRVRNKGYADQITTFGSTEEADAFIKTVEAEKSRGLFRDYTAARTVTTAELIHRYIRDECPKLKGGDNYAVILRAMVADSNHELAQRIAARQREQIELGYMVTKIGANRTPMVGLEWLNKPITDVTAVEIEDFIADRLEEVVPSTVCRQLDLLRAVYTVATKTWGYYLDRFPLDGVRRPAFFDERNRRLEGDEEIRLLDAARHEDQLRSIELRVQELLQPARADAAAQASKYGAKKVIKEAREAVSPEALRSYVLVPTLETLVQFQLATAGRRGETLGLCWDRVNFEKQTAHLHKTKNGRPRDLSLRLDLMELMERLPRSSDLVFDISDRELRNAWKRMCESAHIQDLRLHDLRHESISRAAESGLFPTVLDLQAFSGHRDLRSLSRYTHMMPTAIAKRLDAAEAARLAAMTHNGRSRLKHTDLMFLGVEEVGPTTSATTLQPVATNVIAVNFRSAA